MSGKLIIGIVIMSTLGIVGLAVWQQQKRLPELEARRPAPPVTPPPGLLGKDGKNQSGPLDFAALFGNLKPAKQECFREKFGQERLNQMLANQAFVPAPEDNSIIGECLLAGATFQESAPSTTTESAGP
ncbi:MAG: hypothetical protein Q7S09_03925 [bacterium]|nr:hypothetical protein [bacterium]